MKSPTQLTTRNNKHRYRKVALKMWADEKFSALSALPPSGQSLWLFLLVYPAQDGIPGVYRAGRASMAESLGWDIEDFDACFKEITEQGMAKADWKARLVWLPNAVKFNPPESPNVVIWWSKSWPEIPECELKTEIHETLRKHICEAGESYCRAFDEFFPKPANEKSHSRVQVTKKPQDKASDKPSDNPSDKASVNNPSDTPSDNTSDNPSDNPCDKALSIGKQSENNTCDKASHKGCDNQEQEHEHEQEHNCGEKGGVGESSSAGPSPSAPALSGGSLDRVQKTETPQQGAGRQGVIEGTEWQAAMDGDEIQDAIRESQTERGTRLPADYVVCDSWLLHARKTRPDLQAEQIKSAAASFVAHWSSKPGKDGLKLNWLSTWLNWVRKEKAWPAGGAARSDRPRLLPPSSATSLDEQERERRMREFQARFPNARFVNRPSKPGG